MLGCNRRMIIVAVGDKITQSYKRSKTTELNWTGLSPTRHKIDNFGDVLPSQSLGSLLKKTKPNKTKLENTRPKWSELKNTKKQTKPLQTKNNSNTTKNHCSYMCQTSDRISQHCRFLTCMVLAWKSSIVLESNSAKSVFSTALLSTDIMHLMFKQKKQKFTVRVNRHIIHSESSIEML